MIYAVYLSITSFVVVVVVVVDRSSESLQPLSNPGFLNVIVIIIVNGDHER